MKFPLLYLYKLIIAQTQESSQYPYTQKLPLPFPVKGVRFKYRVLLQYLASLLHALSGRWNRHIPVHPQSSE